MPKYLVTGNAGSGKTTVIDELARRGFTAYSTDDVPNVTSHVELKTGKLIEKPPYPIDWNKYAWNWQETELKKLLASDDTVFLGAIVSNQQKFYPLFDKVFVLLVDVNTLLHRLHMRTTNDYGKHPEQLAEILEGHDEFQAQLLVGASERKVSIDATQSLKKVVDQILKNVR